MICKNCGARVPDESPSCPKCGTPLDVTASAVPRQSVQVYTPRPNVQSNPSAAPRMQQPMPPRPTPPRQSPSEQGVTKRKKGVNLKILIPCMCGAVAVVIAVCLIVLLAGRDVRTFEKALNSGNQSEVRMLYTKASTHTSQAKKKSKYDTCIYDYLQAHYEEICELTFAEGANSANMESELSEFRDSNGYEMVSNLGDFDNLASNSEDLLERIEDIYTSKFSYISAVGYAEKGAENEQMYLKAVNELAKMDPEDAMYARGQELIATETKNYLDSVSVRVDAYIAQEDFVSAKELLLKAQENLPNNAVVSEKINSVMNAAAEKYANKAEEFFNAGDIDAAIGNLQVALQFAPDNGDYQSRLENYQLYVPYPLYVEDNMLSTQKDIAGYAYLRLAEYVAANTGTQMENCIRFHQDTIGVNSCSVTYNLGGRYSVITGTWARAQEYKSQDGYEYFEVYGDGKLLYTSPRVGRDVLPQEISCNVTGVQTLTIVFKGESTEWDSEAFLSNLVAKKTVS